MALYLDGREGSLIFALLDDTRNLLDDCGYCDGRATISKLNPKYYVGHRDNKGRDRCKHCYGTGKYIEKLHGADVCFAGNFSAGPITAAIEIKTVAEFIASIDNGKFQSKQMVKMLESYDVNWLLIYGECRQEPITGRLQELKGRKWRDVTIGSRPVLASYLEGFLITPPFVETGFLVKQVKTREEAAAWIRLIYESWSKPYDYHHSMQKFDTSCDIRLGGKPKRVGAGLVSGDIPFTPRPVNDESIIAIANHARQCSGMGYKKCLAAAIHFRSVRAMVNATKEQWMEVRFKQGKRIAKIGQTLAESNVRAFTRVARKYRLGDL